MSNVERRKEACNFRILQWIADPAYSALMECNTLDIILEMGVKNKTAFITP